MRYFDILQLETSIDFLVYSEDVSCVTSERPNLPTAVTVLSLSF